MVLDTQLDYLEGQAIECFNKNSGFITSYLINPLLFELLFHSTLAPTYQMCVTRLLLLHQLIWLYNRLLFHPIMLVVLLSPSYMFSSPVVNLFLYGLLANDDIMTSMIQSFFGYTISHLIGLPAGIATVALIALGRDCVALQHHIENRDMKRFYDAWDRLHGGLPLHVRLWVLQKEWFICIDTVLTRRLSPTVEVIAESDQE